MLNYDLLSFIKFIWIVILHNGYRAQLTLDGQTARSLHGPRALLGPALSVV